MRIDLRPNLEPVDPAERARLLANPTFGTVFTDNMIMVKYSAAQGWHDAALTARAPIPMDPAAAVFHYAQEIFEGMKAYRYGNTDAALFRPDANAARFASSAERLAMPLVPPDLFVACVDALVREDQAWIPDIPGGSLYLRPFMIANEAFLGVRPATEYLFMVIACPVGPYFRGKTEAVSVWATRDYTRAARGGTGAAKCGGNYAASLLAQTEAYAHDCQQVVFLDAAEGRWIEELGGMNVFFVMADGSLVTPPLGTILPGITRSSILILAREMGITVREAPYAIDQWEADATSGALQEAFACGTAAMVTPIGQIRSRDGAFRMADAENAGPVTTRLRAALQDIQAGRTPDRHGWIHRISP